MRDGWSPTATSQGASQSPRQRSQPGCSCAGAGGRKEKTCRRNRTSYRRACPGVGSVWRLEAFKSCCVCQKRAAAATSEYEYVTYIHIFIHVVVSSSDSNQQVALGDQQVRSPCGADVASMEICEISYFHVLFLIMTRIVMYCHSFIFPSLCFFGVPWLRAVSAPRSPTPTNKCSLY